MARLADHVVWLEGGRVRATGPLGPVLARLDVAGAFGDEAGAVVEARVARHDPAYELSALDSVWGTLWVRRLEREAGETVRVQVFARDVSLSLGEDADSTILNRFAARIVELAPAGPGQVLVRLGRPGITGSEGEEADDFLLARITQKSAEHLGLGPGAEVYARVKSVSLFD